MTNFPTIKPKTVVVAKKEEHKLISIEQIINEIEPTEFVNIKVKFLSAADQKTVNSLKLREYVATDNGESFINITMFEELIDKVDIDMTYSFFNLQVVTYNNQKKLRSTTLTTVNKQQNALSQINISSTDLLSTEETKEMTFDDIDDERLISQLVCTKCNTSIPSTTQKIVKCIACNSIQLVSSYQTHLMLKLTPSKKSYWCNAEILKPILSKDLIIGQNEEFIMYMLSNDFEIKYLNNVIKTIKSVKPN